MFESWFEPNRLQRNWVDGGGGILGNEPGQRKAGVSATEKQQNVRTRTRGNRLCHLLLVGVRGPIPRQCRTYVHPTLRTG